VLHALKLRRSIRQLPTLLRSRSIQQLNYTVEQLSGADAAKVESTIKEEISARKKFWAVRRHLFDASAGHSASKSSRTSIPSQAITASVTPFTVILHCRRGSPYSHPRLGPHTRNGWRNSLSPRVHHFSCCRYSTASGLGGMPSTKHYYGI
jgi:hypothetical protein